MTIDVTLERPAWHRHAACRGADPDTVALFFPHRGADVRRAQAICNTCPVRRPCAEYALDSPEHHGIWGGLSERQRRRIRRQRGHPDD